MSRGPLRRGLQNSDKLIRKRRIRTLNYFDVGQADSIFVKQNDNTVLIDAGNNADGEKIVDFLDKDVLTVLASSDQFFLANYLGARKVYSFDKNILALYYYYMRKWTLSINKEMYPYELLDDNYIWLAKLLSKVKPEKREEFLALKFWKQHLSDTSRVHSLFHDDEVDGKTMFKSINSIGSVADRENNFLNINLFLSK